MVLYGYYMRPNPEHIVGIDGGGTGCRVRLVTARGGRVLATATGGPANVNSDFRSACDNILRAIAGAYAAAGLDFAQRSRDIAWLGLAGAGVGDLAERMERALGFARATVSTDRETTLEGALGPGEGAVAMLGTGSFFMRRAQGRERCIGGWGYQLGDECGGAWLGRELLRAVLHAEDGLRRHSPLTRAILERHSARPDEIVRFAHAVSPGEIARLAPEIAAAARNGDAVATEILNRGSELLCRRLDALGAQEGPVLCLLGGLAPVYEPRLPDRYRRLLAPARGDALDGTIALARRHHLPCPQAEAG